jgi:hypothetical protein
VSIKQLISDLKASNLVAECPVCQEEFNLSDTLLFDGMKKFPKTAEGKKSRTKKEITLSEKMA